MAQDRQSRQWVFFLPAAGLWAFLLYWSADRIADRNLGFLILTVLLFSLPVMLSGLYGSTVRQSYRLAFLLQRGKLLRLLSGRWLRLLFWLCWSPLLTLFLLLQFHAWSNLEWLFFLLVIPVFWCSYRLLASLLGSELKPWLLTGFTLHWACLLCPFIMLLIQAALFGLLPSPAHDSLSAAIASRQALYADMNGNALLRELVGPLSLYQGMQAYLAGFAWDTDFWLALLISFTGNFLVYYTACCMLSCLLIPAVEYRRLITPLTDADTPPSPNPVQLAVTAALSLFVIVFIYVPGMAYLEAWAQQSRLSSLSASVEAEMIRLDRIGSSYYRQGTLAELEQARMQAMREVEGSLAALEQQIDQAFDQMSSNVDLYLDWYYSLGGEYGRLGSLMIGNLENYMQDRLMQYLQQEAGFQAVQHAIEQSLQTHEAAQRQYQQAASAILAANQVTPAAQQSIQVINTVPLEAIMNPPVPRELVNLEQRALASGGGGAAAGVMSAVVVQKIAAKAAGKNLFKLAASALGKMALGKTAGSLAGAGAGAASGAAIGSIVPGPGTAIGAIIGGLAGGILAGIGIDKTLIEIEEVVNREAFRQELLAAIEESRQEFKASLSGGQTSAL